KALRAWCAALALRNGASAALLASTVAICAAQQTSNSQTPTNPQTQPTPVFRTGVNTVLVDLRVLDLGGKFVGDLTKSEFRLFEDDKEQAITTFSLVNVPIVRRTERAIRRSNI